MKLEPTIKHYFALRCSQNTGNVRQKINFKKAIGLFDFDLRQLT